MPVLYKGICRTCHSYYEGYGAVYCSRMCTHKSKERKLRRICFSCGSAFHVRRSAPRHSAAKYCSVKCYRKARIQTQPIVYLGEYYFMDGLKKYFTTNYKNRPNVKLHRVIWENEACDIPPGYVIHHIDENSLNNSLDNLMMLKRGDHTRLHLLNRPVSPETRKIQREITLKRERASNGQFK